MSLVTFLEIKTVSLNVSNPDLNLNIQIYSRKIIQLMILNRLKLPPPLMLISRRSIPAPGQSQIPAA